MEMHETVGLRDVNRSRNTSLEGSDYSDRLQGWGADKIIKSRTQGAVCLAAPGLERRHKDSEATVDSSCEIESHIPLAEF